MNSLSCITYEEHTSLEDTLDSFEGTYTQLLAEAGPVAESEWIVS
jgi:hypothetical protein